jgi:hypothetical protein
MYCPKCGNNGLTDGGFCVTDGTRMRNYPKCKCGKELWSFQEFCDKCGEPNTNEYIPRKAWYKTEGFILLLFIAGMTIALGGAIYSSMSGS